MDNALSMAVQQPLSLANLFLNLFIGLLLAMAVRWHFLKFGSTLSNRADLAQVLPFVLLTTILIISVVKSSLALSLGLVGALSIVRFRTPIKEPEELAYLFISIAIGLGLGADRTIVTVCAALAILAATAVFKMQVRQKREQDLYLSIEIGDMDSGANKEILKIINEKIESKFPNADLRRFDTQDRRFGVTYFVTAKDTESLSDVSDDLRKNYPNISITFLDQNQLPTI